MKKYYSHQFLFLLVLSASFLFNSCKPQPACPTCKTDCCKDNPYNMHPSAMSLMQSYQDLAKNYGVSNCNVGGAVGQTYNVSSAMSAAGYNVGMAGFVTFGSFYYEDSTNFRTIWGGDAGNFKYYGACYPNPIVFPFKGIAQNHVYEARLIPVADYQAATGTKDYNGLTSIGRIKTKDITAIENIRMEAITGYIHSTEPSLYDNVLSSKGFICDVSLKGKAGKTTCYIINNYDASATLIWKVKRGECACCIDFDSPTFTAGTTYSSPTYSPGSFLFKACDFNVTISNFMTGTTSNFSQGQIKLASSSFGSGNVFQTNHVTLRLKDVNGGSNSIVTFDYNDLDGQHQVNLSVNGVLYQGGKLSATPANLGGVSVVVTTNPATGNNETGTVTLTGNIKEFSIGGKEFFIDNICRK